MEPINHKTLTPSHNQAWNTAFQPASLEHSIFAQLTSISRNISIMTAMDAEIFRKAFAQEEIAYCNSWLYLLRTTRNQAGGWGYKFVSQDTTMGIGYRNNTLYLIHPMGPGRFSTTLSLCIRIQQAIDCSIILKKVDQQLYDYLAATNRFQEHEGGLTILEEEAFSEHILPLETLYHPDNGLYFHPLPFTRKVRRFEKDTMKLTRKNDISMLEANPGFNRLLKSNPDKFASYMPLVQEIRSTQTNSGRYISSAYYDEQGVVQGLYISERLAEGTMGLYCAVTAKAGPGMTEWMDYDFFQYLYESGIHSLYLGGSETAGVDAYVKKLLPTTPTYLMRPMKMCS